MSMETGVDGGSMLVPELVWRSSASMRVVGGVIMFIEVAGAFCGIDICGECMSIPGMSGGGGCLVCALVGTVANRTSENEVAARR